MCIEWNLWSQQPLAQTTVYVQYMCHGKLLWKYVESDLGSQLYPTYYTTNCHNQCYIRIIQGWLKCNFKRFARTNIHYLYPKFLLRSTPIQRSITPRRLRIPFCLDRVFLHSLFFVWLYSYLKWQANNKNFDGELFIHVMSNNTVISNIDDVSFLPIWISDRQDKYIIELQKICTIMRSFH